MSSLLKKIPVVLTGVLMFFSPYDLLAATPTSGYKIFIDAGSTSSRIHLFQYDMVGNKVPVISELFTESAKPALASFATNPQDAGNSLKPLLDDVSSQLQARGVTSPVPVNLFATAGMRLLPVDQQSPIYNNVTTFIQSNYSLITPGDIETITGQMEGLYDWLDVNYLADNFQSHQVTVGAIDMGGASTEIAFETNSGTPNNAITINVNGQPYRVFSKSFLGLGQDQARATMGNGILATSCYPAAFPMNGSDQGNFNFSLCQDSYRKIAANYHVNAEVPPLTEQKFIAFSGIYYDYQFFMPDLIANEQAFETQMKTVCAESWQQLQNNYPTQDSSYLSAYCANGVYVDNLLYQNYHLTDSQLTINNQLNGKNIDWTLGAALYSLIH